VSDHRAILCFNSHARAASGGKKMQEGERKKQTNDGKSSTSIPVHPRRLRVRRTHQLILPGRLPKSIHAHAHGKSGRGQKGRWRVGHRSRRFGKRRVSAPSCPSLPMTAIHLAPPPLCTWSISLSVVVRVAEGANSRPTSRAAILAARRRERRTRSKARPRVVD